MLNRPTKEKVFFKRLAKDLTLNFVTIEDDEWIANQWTAEELENGFKSGDLAVVLLMFWRFLDDESKRIVRDVKCVKWDGMKEVEMTTDNPVEKLKMLISGSGEAKEIIRALFQTRIKSNADADSNQKKSLTAAEASRITNSSTSSPASTGSALERSAG